MSILTAQEIFITVRLHSTKAPREKQRKLLCSLQRRWTEVKRSTVTQTNEQRIVLSTVFPDCAGVINLQQVCFGMRDFLLSEELSCSFLLARSNGFTYSQNSELTRSYKIIRGKSDVLAGVTLFDVLHRCSRTPGSLWLPDDPVSIISN